MENLSQKGFLEGLLEGRHDAYEGNGGGGLALRPPFVQAIFFPS